jgi:hypothetical protein
MALAKIYKVKNVVNTILLWLREEIQNNLEPELVKTFVNLAVMEEAQILSESKDIYGKTANVSDGSTNVSGAVVTGASFDNPTRTVTKTTHGLTVADIGKRIILSVPSTRTGIFVIESITDVDNFVVDGFFGATFANVEYTMLSDHYTPTIDISHLKIMNIIKLRSSIHGEVKKLGDIQADNITRNDFKAEHNLYWYKHGENIHLVAPNSVIVGTLVLFYNTYPEIKKLDDDFLDIPDIYVPNVIRKTKAMCLEHLNIIPPNVKPYVSKESNAKRRKSIDTENKIGIDG